MADNQSILTRFDTHVSALNATLDKVNTFAETFGQKTTLTDATIYHQAIFTYLEACTQASERLETAKAKASALPSGSEEAQRVTTLHDDAVKKIKEIEQKLAECERKSEDVIDSLGGDIDF